MQDWEDGGDKGTSKDTFPGFLGRGTNAKTILTFHNERTTNNADREGYAQYRQKTQKKRPFPLKSVP